MVLIVMLIIYFVIKNKEREPHVEEHTANHESTRKNENSYDYRDEAYYSSRENYYGYAEKEAEGYYYELDASNVKSTKEYENYYD